MSTGTEDYSSLRNRLDSYRQGGTRVNIEVESGDPDARDARDVLIETVADDFAIYRHRPRSIFSRGRREGIILDAIAQVSPA